MIKGFVYLLLSKKDKRTYLGSTVNLKNRIIEHNDGLCFSTKYRRPLELIYSEEFDDIELARQREHYLKSRSGRRELKKIFENLKKK